MDEKMNDNTLGFDLEELKALLGEETPEEPEQAAAPAPAPVAAPEPQYSDAAPVEKPKKKKGGKVVLRRLGFVVRRSLLVLGTLLGMLAVLVLVAAVFIGYIGGAFADAVTGPKYPEVQKLLVMSLEEASATKWIMPLLLGQETVDAIIAPPVNNLEDEQIDTDLIQIDLSGAMSDSSEWDDHPDGVYIENVKGSTFNGYVMVIRDPSKVYLATSTEDFSPNIPGKRITEVIERDGAIAAINAGAFFDNGTASSVVGSYPQGLTVANGEVVWTSGTTPVGEQTAFVGFTEDHKMVVGQGFTEKTVEELKIRDGCSFGPVLIMNGVENEGVYNGNSGLNPRTAIGQRADGAVLFVCIDGRQASSLGGTYADLINIMVEYGAVNACNLDGGSSTVMLYRDPDSGEVSMVNSYSLMQEQPRRMPTFFMVRPANED